MDIVQDGGLDWDWYPGLCDVPKKTDDFIRVSVDYLNYGSVNTAETTLAKTPDGSGSTNS